MKIEDSMHKLLALTFSESSGLIKNRLNNLRSILTHLDPDSFKPCDSSMRGYGFDSIHLDTYNRFAENVSHT